MSTDPIDHAAAFARLETWSDGHKARTVSIESPDGYGAGCWTVTLGHEHGITTAAEASFFTLPAEKGGDAEYRRQAEVAGYVYALAEDAEEDWPGLARTVACALDAFGRGVWGARENKPSPMAFLTAERAAIKSERDRLWDLVRHQRGALHDEGLVTDEEYVALAANHGAVARLEGYDAMRAGRDALAAHVTELEAVVVALLAHEVKDARLRGLVDCTCINHSCEADRAYEAGQCPHQRARAVLAHIEGGPSCSST